MYLRFLTPLAGICLFSSALPAQEQKQPPVDRLIAQNIEARGGAAALRAIQSLHLIGRMMTNEGKTEFRYQQLKKRPGVLRTEYTIQGMTAVQAYDGTQAWKISPFNGRKDPEKMSADDAKELVEDADVDGPLVDWKAKGSTVEYLGTEDVEGTQAHKLKVVRKNGDVAYVYLDPDHFLEIRIVSQRIEKGAQVEIETDLGDYEKVNGVFIPFSIESAPKGAAEKQKIVIEKAEANTPVDEGDFRFPVSPSR